MKLFIRLLVLLSFIANIVGCPTSDDSSQSATDQQASQAESQSNDKTGKTCSVHNCILEERTVRITYGWSPIVDPFIDGLPYSDTPIFGGDVISSPVEKDRKKWVCPKCAIERRWRIAYALSTGTPEIPPGIFMEDRTGGFIRPADAVE